MKSEYQLSIIDHLRELRLRRNMSQAQVAIVLGISPGQVGNIETPKAGHKYTLEQIKTLCDELEISVAEIFLSKEEKNMPVNEQIDALVKNIVQYEQ